MSATGSALILLITRRQTAPFLNENVDLHGRCFHLPAQLESNRAGLRVIERVQRLFLANAEDDLTELLGLADLLQNVRQSLRTSQCGEVPHCGEGEVEPGQISGLSCFECFTSDFALKRSF
jgi:hypothetical protein